MSGDHAAPASEGEALYDAEIAPALAALAEKCSAAGMNFVAVVEYEHGSVGLTAKAMHPQAAQFSLARMAALAFGNADALIFAMIRHGREHEHNSIYLHRLTEPQP